MKKVILYIAMSLDGYIADKKGNVDWLTGDDSDENNSGSYPEFIETIDTIIWGYNTYYQIITELSPNNWVYKGKTSYILTHKEKKSNNNEIIFINKNISDLVTKLKEQDGKNIWICGGANIVKQCIENNLIDIYHITIIPTILGDGIRLFNQHDIKAKKLNLISTKSYNSIVELIYKIKK